MAQGNEAFARRLKQVPDAVRKAVSEAIRKDAEEWVRTAKMVAPQDPEDGTPLHDSVRNYATETGGQVVRAGGPTTMVDGYDYALGQEYGTQEMGASPFYWPTYRMLKRRFASRRRRAMAKALKAINDK